MQQAITVLQVALISLVFLTSGTASELVTPEFSIATKRDSDKIEVSVRDSMTIVSIHSPFGISDAIIKRTREQWPDSVVLNLHLKGLENFQVANGKVMLVAAVSGFAEKMQVRQWKANEEDALLNPRSPYWMKIRRIGSDGRPVSANPMKTGYFEITLPKQLLEDSPKSITVSWIDFYRG